MISIEKKILRIVRETISAHRMFDPGDLVLVAVSGGPDSIALVYLIHSLAAEFSLRPAIAHLNHCLRGSDSDRDAEFVAETARQLNLPIYAQSEDVRAFQQGHRLSLEEAARMVRYRFYDAVVTEHGFNKIALGHQSDDNAELVLMNLLRGSGPLGLSGIAPVRGGKIVRPLIRLRRSELVDYLVEKKLTYVTDASNTDLRYMRNKIRHQLIPELQTDYNPRIIETLNRLGEILQAEDQWAAKALEPVFEQCVAFRTDDKINLSLPAFNPLAKAIKRRIVRTSILSIKKDLRRITLVHVDAILGLLEKGRKPGRLNLPDGILVVTNGAELSFQKFENKLNLNDSEISPDSSRGYHYTLSPSETLCIKEADASIVLCEIDIEELPDFEDVDATVAFFDLDRLTLPLAVRNLRPGDRFSPLGLKGTQKVKKYFANLKIPVRQRRTCPLLLSKGRIVWIAGHRIDNAVKVTPQTRRVLRAELLLA
jgi:tRNA(Ile)-lysidine synthase